MLPKCSVPWTSNITGLNKNHINDTEIPCNTTDAAIQSVLLIGDYFERASRHGFPECKGKSYESKGCIM